MCQWVLDTKLLASEDANRTVAPLSEVCAPSFDLQKIDFFNSDTYDNIITSVIRKATPMKTMSAEKIADIKKKLKSIHNPITVLYGDRIGIIPLFPHHPITISTDDKHQDPHHKIVQAQKRILKCGIAIRSKL